MSTKYLVDFVISGKYNERHGNGFGVYNYDICWYYFKIDLNGNVDIKRKDQYHSQTYVNLLNINDNIPLQQSQQSLVTKLHSKYKNIQRPISVHDHSEDIIYFIEFIKKINEETNKKEEEYDESIKYLKKELTKNKEEYNNYTNDLKEELMKKKEESRKKMNELNDEKWRLTSELINTNIMQKKKEEEKNEIAKSLQNEKEKNETLLNDNKDLIIKLVSCVTVYSFLVCIILIMYIREIESHYIH